MIRAMLIFGAGMSLASCAIPQAMIPDDIGTDCRFGENQQLGEWYECGVDVLWELEFTTTGQDISSYFNSNQALVSFDGSTVALPGQGIYRLEAFNTSGALIGSMSQSWVLSGTNAVPTNPQQVTSWLSSMTVDIARIEATIPHFQVGHSAGVNTFSTAYQYGSQTVGVASTTFFAGSGCGTAPFSDPSACLQ